MDFCNCTFNWKQKRKKERDMNRRKGHEGRQTPWIIWKFNRLYERDVYRTKLWSASQRRIINTVGGIEVEGRKMAEDKREYDWQGWTGEREMRGSVKRIRPSPVSLIIFKKMSVHNVYIYIYICNINEWETSLPRTWNAEVNKLYRVRVYYFSTIRFGVEKEISAKFERKFRRISLQRDVNSPIVCSRLGNWARGVSKKREYR